MRIYISGPITGTTDYQKRFREAAERIKKLGAEYVNPAEMEKAMPEANYEDYMNIELRLLGKCDAMVMLAGSEDSEGCRREYHEAKLLGLPIFYDLNGAQPLYSDATTL